jgi:hypothetical protein
MNWRDHIRNDFDGGKIKPYWISPGGRNLYRRPKKYPQIPAPIILKIDYPYIIIDNWLFRFFPLSDVKMRWLCDSAVTWAAQSPQRGYKTKLCRFINEVELKALKALP